MIWFRHKKYTFRTSRKRWKGKRSPADWAGRTVWSCRTEGVFQFAFLRIGSSEPYLIPGSRREMLQNFLQTSGTWGHVQNMFKHFFYWHLQFAPQSTLEASNAVHDPGDVLKGHPEIILMNTRGTAHVTTLQYIKEFVYWRNCMCRILTFSFAASVLSPANRVVSSKCNGKDLEILNLLHY